ncbi:hypothetical protein AB0D95_02990 [Streptomyces chilikensis]|uniref:Gene product 88 domain-containing protein n=1 Tax=Streptomyces chilikensis TaxID=1194079 RepID=A0ABV3EJ85_9ACTN
MPDSRPRRLLTQNSELRKIRVWNWTLPALATRLPDGRTISTCPSAGVCAQACFARAGAYRFPAVAARHVANLAYVVDDPQQWEWHMMWELREDRFQGAWVRVHDAGDFFSDAYLAAWMRIMRTSPNTGFYAYTKEIARFRRMVEPDPPPNFRWVYSWGGRDDDLLTPEDRTVDVFPDEESIEAAGWHSQHDSDLLSVLGPPNVACPANNIPQLLKRQAGRTFREWQTEVDARRAEKKSRHSP